MTKSQPHQHNDHSVNSSNNNNINNDHINQPLSPSKSTTPKSWPELPSWAHPTKRSSWGTILQIQEWDDNGTEDCNQNNTQYRTLNGWKGNDLVHSQSSPVRILEYRLLYNKNDDDNSNDNKATLTGIVHFTPNAESHKGYCHGGSMCSILDDIIGWTGFCATGRCIPWSGFTVQVNSKLFKPVQVDSILKIVCTVEKIEKRKVWLKAILVDPSNDVNGNVPIHAEGEGLVILNKGIVE